MGRVRRILQYWFPPGSGRPRREDGLLSPPGPDGWALVVAVIIAATAALMFEWFARVQPVPPGGDPGTWLMLSYPWVGIQHPASVAILTYPPSSFPFLGLAVLAGGGPLNGARLYAGIVIAAMALSMYSLGRSVFQLRIVALLMEAALVVQPDFQQLYYFGGYPNMFGFVFFFLALSYFVRFLRSRRPLHVAVFWVATTLAVLSEALVAVSLVATLAFFGLMLLWYRRLPRQLFSSPASIAGGIGFIVASIGYYVGVTLANIHSPNYLSTGSLAETSSATLIPTVLKPFYLESLAKGINGSGFPLGQTLAIELIVGASAAVALALVVFRFIQPRLVSYRWMVLAAWLLGVFGISELTYFGGLGGDYRRVAYFLYPFTLLGAGLLLDLLLVWLVPPPAWRPTTAPAARVADPVGSPAWRRPRGWTAGHRTYAVIVALMCVGLLASTVTDTMPNASGFGTYFTRTGHDQSFVDGMNAITASGVPGNIFSSSEAVDRWPSTLTSRDIVEVRSPTGFTYTASTLVLDELANFAQSSRFTVTNGQVAGLIPGFTNGTMNATPEYAVFSYGVLYPILQIGPQNIQVSLAGHGGAPVYSKSLAPLPELIVPSDPSNTTIELVFNQTGYELVETITAVPGTASLSVTCRAVATGSAGIAAVKAKLSTSTGNPVVIQATPSGGFTWLANTTAGNLSVLAELSSGASVTGVPSSGEPIPHGANVSVVAQNSGPNGTGSLGFAVTLTAPQASNPAPLVAGYYSSADLLRLWDIHFVLLDMAATSTGSAPLAQFESEYGAAPFFSEGIWTILTLPTSLPR